MPRRRATPSSRAARPCGASACGCARTAAPSWNRADGRAVDPRNPQRGSVWTVEDVTEQRRAEEELQRVLAEQQALIDNVSVGIAFRRNRKTVRCNRRYEEMFGYAAGEAAGTSTRDLYFTDEEYRQAGRVYQELDKGLAHVREQWLRRKDGSGFWCRVNGRAVQPGEPDKGYVWLLTTSPRSAPPRSACSARSPSRS